MRSLPQLSVFSMTCPTDPKETCSFATLSQAVFYHPYHLWLFGSQLRQHVLEWVSLPSFTGAIGRTDCKQIFTAPLWTDVKQCPMRADKLTDPIHQWRMREGGREHLLCTPPRDAEQFHRWASKAVVSDTSPYLIACPFPWRQVQVQGIQR